MIDTFNSNTSTRRVTPGAEATQNELDIFSRKPRRTEPTVFGVDMWDWAVWGVKGHVYAQTNRKRPLPASALTQKNKGRPAAGSTRRQGPLPVPWISSDTITVPGNTTHLCTQNCRSRRTPCCCRLPGQISTGPLSVGLWKPERKTNTASLLPPSPQHVEREKSQTGGGKQTAGSNRSRTLPSSPVCRARTERKAGRESCGLPIPASAEGRPESRCNR